MAADPHQSQTNLDNPVEIVICRTFAAPRELVWQAWTDPRHVGQWWGPAGYTTTTHAMDFRPGGHGATPCTGRMARTIRVASTTSKLRNRHDSSISWR